MPIELTNAEVDAAIESAYMATQQTNIVDGIRPPFIVGKELWRVIYRAGLAAGIERSAKVCDAERNFSEVMPMREPEEREYARGWRSACWGCAAAIRALLNPPA